MSQLIDGLNAYFHAFVWFISAVSDLHLLLYMVAALAAYAIICLTWSLILDD